jgi:maltoporin
MNKFKLIIAATGVLILSGALFADDTFEYKGYARIGKEWTMNQYGYQGDFGLCGKNGAQKMNGRLGQEGDQQYVENTLIKNWVMENGCWAKGVFLLTFEGDANSDAGDYVQTKNNDTNFQMRNRQYYVEIGGMNFAPNTTVWVGKRFLNRKDVYLLDWYFLDFSGTGFGATNIASTGLDLAYVQWNQGGDVTVDGKVKGRDVANTVVAKWEYKMVRADASYTFRNKQSDTAKATHGYFASLLFKPENFFYIFHGESAVFAQYAAGGSAENIWYANRTPNYADRGSRINNKLFCYDIAATGTAQVTDEFSFSTVAGFMQIKAPKEALASGGDTRVAQNAVHAEKAFIAVRPHYAINNSVAFELELGYAMARCNEYRVYGDGVSGGNYVNFAFNNGGDFTDRGWKTEFKATPAIVFGVDKGFFSRPQVRLFMNYEVISSNLKGQKSGKFEDKTSFVTWGCQAEAWW